MRIRPYRGIAAILLLAPLAAVYADFQSGQDAYSSGDYETAIAEWQPLAEAGNADAQFGMGLLYANGFGVMMDDASALKWYGMAAEQNHAEAQANIAIFHANGWGVPQSDAEAFKWYSLAAEQGVMSAQSAVAKMYASSYSPQHDLVQAHKWFSIASEMGDLNAASKRDDLIGKMSPEQLAAANEQAASWLESYRSLAAAK